MALRPFNARRRFLANCAGFLLAGMMGRARGALQNVPESDDPLIDMPASSLKLFLCGDVMTGRGIDQILPTPSDPELHEPYVTDARSYVRLAERKSGAIPSSVSSEYIWGDALEILQRQHPAARIVNLETAVTTSDAWWEEKGIHYRMHPANIECLTVADLDVCVLANNHVMDYGYPGLEQTLQLLEAAALHPVGAGMDRAAAAAPVRLDLEAGRLWIFALGSGSSGIPPAWDAGPQRAGVNLINPSPATADELTERIARLRQPGDRVLVSVHWGGNWGYEVPDTQRAFAHRLIDSGQVDLIHGHSSHHPKGIEVHRGRLILYGCGDFINDYEGIGGYEAYRSDLGLMYFPSLAEDGELQRLELVPTRLHRFQVCHAGPEGVAWLQAMLEREGKPLGTGVRRSESGDLLLTF